MADHKFLTEADLARIEIRTYRDAAKRAGHSAEAQSWIKFCPNCSKEIKWK